MTPTMDTTTAPVDEETPEMPADTAPVISSASVSDVKHDGATITLASDEPVQAYLEYGTSVAYGMSTPITSEFSTTPSFVLSNLLSDTVYHFRVMAVDASGNTTITADETFKTLVAPTPESEPTPEPQPVATSTPPTSATSTSPTTNPSTATTTPTSTPTETESTDVGDSEEVSPPPVVIVEKTATSTVKNKTAPPPATGGGLPVGPFRPLILRVQVADSKVVFNWRKFGDSQNLTTTLIIRKEGTEYIKSRIDGKIVYQGSGSSFVDTNVQNGKEYHYALYVSGPHERFSAPARFKAIPTSAKPLLIPSQNTAMATITAPKPPSDFPRDLHRGLTGEDVSRLQQFLVDNEYYPEALISGYFGPLTRAALVRFQQSAGIAPAVGYFGVLTRAKAESILSPSF